MSDVSKLLRSLTKNEQCKQIAQVAHKKWATMSASLRSLIKNERPWTNCSGRSPKMSDWANCSLFRANRSFAWFFAKNKRFARKTNERIPSPAVRTGLNWIALCQYLEDIDWIAFCFCLKDIDWLNSTLLYSGSFLPVKPWQPWMELTANRFRWTIIPPPPQGPVFPH